MMVMAFGSAKAQDETPAEEPGSNLSVTVDFTTKALWRGGYCGGPSIQPGIEYSIGGFSVSTWNSSEINMGQGGFEEIDFALGYSIGGASILLSDYCWNNAYGNFEYFGPYKENHFLELGLGYDFGELTSLPLAVSVNMMLAGANRNFSDEAAHSTYVDLVYSPSCGGFDFAFTLGAAIENEESLMYSKKDGFNIVNIDCAVSKSFPLKSFATITPRAELMCNPVGFDKHGEVYFVAGLGIAF